MKKIISIVVLALISLVSFGQNARNNTADSIIGNYESLQEGDAYKVEVTKNSNGSYKARIYWVKDSVDPKTGKKALDVKNPDKALRNNPVDKVVLFDGLKYDSAKKVWNGAKIYDPQRGIKANLTCSFLKDGRLALKGSLMGISETAYWTPIAK